jgi:hypothetical protein
MANYPAGSVVRMSTAFTVSGANTDPTTVTLYVKLPNAGTQIFAYGSSSMVKDATGLYHYDYATTNSGDFFYRWVGTGTVIAAAEGSFTAGPSAFV